MPQLPISFTRKLPHNAGIAIGPILFIIAILAILAAAIAAGSGSFTASTSTEGDITKASALIQIGENLKVGMDRIIMGGQVDITNVVINAGNTSNTVDLFSPAGGGISAPSDSLANTPGTDHWHYMTGPILGFGTTANETLAVLRVTLGVCQQLNAKANGSAANATPAAADVGAWTADGTLTSTQGTTNWPAGLSGKPVGCINNTNGSPGSPTYYFYQVLFVQ